MTSHCPSKDWDRYCRDNEPPEVCPWCARDNADEDGNWICKEAEGFCSVDCSLMYEQERIKEDNALAKYEEEMDAMSADIEKAIHDTQDVGEEYDFAEDDLAFDAARERDR